MIPPYTYAAARMAEERRSETLRNGELAHLISIARPARAGRTIGLLARAGSLLTAVEGRLRESCVLFWSRSPACAMDNVS
jgi:hypothetical protein